MKVAEKIGNPVRSAPKTAAMNAFCVIAARSRCEVRYAHCVKPVLEIEKRI